MVFLGGNRVMMRIPSAVSSLSVGSAEEGRQPALDLVVT